MRENERFVQIEPEFAAQQIVSNQRLTRRDNKWEGVVTKEPFYFYFVVGGEQVVSKKYKIVTIIDGVEQNIM